MNTVTLKRLRPASLVIFVFGIVAFVASLQAKNDVAFVATAFVAFGSLCFFTFTEAFLFRPPERAMSSIWMARIFFVPNLLVVLSLAVQFSQHIA